MRTIDCSLGAILLIYSLSAHAVDFPPVLDPSSLLSVNGGDGTAGVAFKTREDADHSSATGVLDVNGDGIADAGISVEYEVSVNNAFVLSGGPGPWPAELDAENSSIFKIDLTQGLQFGNRVVTSGGDFSGNGIGAMIIGHLESCIESCNYGSFVGKRTEGLNSAANWNFGSNAKFIGDVNGDGKDDLITNNRYDTAFAVYIGTPRLVMGDSTLELKLEGGQSFGISLVSGGDINGDGFSDIGFSLFGNHYYLFGSAALTDLNEIEISAMGTVAHPAITLIHGTSPPHHMAIEANGDFNGDGKADWLIRQRLGVGGPDFESQAYIVFGSDFTNGDIVDIEQLNPEFGGNGSEGIGIRYSETIQAINYVGDINNDGFDDIGIVSAQSPGGAVLFGHNDANQSTFEIDSLHPDNGGDGSLGFLIANSESSLQFGDAPLGDFNADGIDDLMITVSATDTTIGYTYIVFSSPTFADDDNDSVDNSVDNCLLVANPDQLDEDNDGYGTACDADFDNNCVTNFADISTFIPNFNSNQPEFDLDGSGNVNFLDFNLIISMFLQEPGPSAIANTCD